MCTYMYRRPCTPMSSYTRYTCTLLTYNTSTSEPQVSCRTSRL